MDTLIKIKNYLENKEFLFKEDILDISMNVIVEKNKIHKIGEVTICRAHTKKVIRISMIVNGINIIIFQYKPVSELFNYIKKTLIPINHNVF